jgi:hypothetical protein
MPDKSLTEKHQLFWTSEDMEPSEREIVLEAGSPQRSETARKGYDRVLVDAECTHDGSIKVEMTWTDTGARTYHRIPRRFYWLKWPKKAENELLETISTLKP